MFPSKRPSATFWVTICFPILLLLCSTAWTQTKLKCKGPIAWYNAMYGY
jgi:hypothetical protein